MKQRLEVAGARRHARGFTLVEMMVSAALMGIVTVYVFGTMGATQRRASVIDRVVETQQNTRVIAELMESDLRHAGFMVPEAAAICGIDNDNAPDQIWLSNYQAIQPDGGLSADLGATIQLSPLNIVPGIQLLRVDRLILETLNPQPAYDNDGDGTLDTDFRLGGGVIVADDINPSRGVACGTVIDIPSANQIRINIETAALGPVPAGGGAPRLRVVPALNYVLNGLDLSRNGYLISSDVEDIQVAYHFDANLDSVIDPNEYRGDGISPDYVANANDGSHLREVRINVVMRTAMEEKDWTKGRFQATENRLAVAGVDGFRRRVHSAVIRIRNVGGRYPL